MSATISARARSRCRSCSPTGAAPTRDRAFWRRVLEDGTIGDGDLEQAIALMRATGAIDDTIERARHFGAVARDALAPFPESAHKVGAARSGRLLHRPGQLTGKPRLPVSACGRVRKRAFRCRLTNANRPP